MDRAVIHKLVTAAKLLEKAGATEYEPERIALAEKSHGLLREVIVAIESMTGGSGAAPRPRERRLLFDRRRSRIADHRQGEVDPPVDQSAALARYQRPIGSERSDGSAIDRSV